MCYKIFYLIEKITRNLQLMRSAGHGLSRSTLSYTDIDMFGFVSIKKDEFPSFAIQVL